MAMVSGPRVFFDVIGTFNAARMISDTKAQMAVVESVMLDAVDGIRQSFAGIGEQISAITDMVVPMGIALAEATIEFEKFAGENRALAAEIIETGQAFGFTAEQSLAAGARMAQLSALVGEAATATATELGQQFALISGMGTEEAMQRMINLQQQTGFMYGDLTNKQFRLLSAENQRNTVMSNTLETLDQLNTVENRSAATLKQITFVMNQFAAQAHQTGESIANMAAMSATLIEAGEEQGKAGRALRMIYARLGSNIQDNNDLLHQYGVTTHDATTGALLPLSNVVAQLAEIFPNLTASQRQNIVQTVAGNDHYVRFVKLIQNQERSAELATDALYNQATATEEVARVTEDAATKYKEAQSELDHVRAQMGESLLPTMTKFIQIQTRMTQAAMELSHIPFFGNMGVMIVHMKEYAMLFGGVVDMMLNIKSVSIAMATYEAVLKSVAGQEVVRTDNYRHQGLLSGITLEIQKEQALIQNTINQLTLERTELENFSLIASTNVAQMKQVELSEHENISRLMKEQNILLDEASRKAMEFAMNQDMAAQSAQNTVNAIRTQAILQQRLTKRQLNFLATEQQKLEETIIGQERMAIILERRIHANSQATDESIRGHKVDQMANNAALRANKQRLAQILTIREEENLAILLDEKHISNADRRASINDELALSLQRIGIHQEELQFLTMEELISLNALAEARAKENMEIEENILLRKKELIEQRKHMMGLKAETVAINQFSAAASMASLGLGVLSGAFGMFGHMLPFVEDKQEAMRISMVLMTFSMIPAVVQMGAMTLSMMGIKTAADLATFSIMGMNAALSFTLVLGGMVALVVLAIAISDIAMESMKATTEIESMNTALATSTTLLSEMTREEAADIKAPQILIDMGYDVASSFDLTTMSMNDFNSALKSTDEAIAELQADQAVYAQDDPFYAMIQKDINALDEFKTLLEQGAMAEFGGLIAGSTDEEKITAAMAAIKSGEIEAAEYYAPAGAKFGGKGYDLARYETTELHGKYKSIGIGVEETTVHAVESVDDMFKKLEDGTITMKDLTPRGKEFFLAIANGAISANESFYKGADGGLLGGIDEIGDGFTEAEEKLRAFANAREELFFGGKASYMSGDMMKQVVNKGVENLYSNVELIMTNNFNGITMPEAIEQVTSGVITQLIASGVPINQAAV